MRNIADYIPIGASNPISRRQLEKVTGFKDRDIRESIAENNATSNIPIINLGKGYFIPTPSEIEMLRDYLFIEISRKKSIENKIENLSSILHNLEDYLEECEKVT